MVPLAPVEGFDAVLSALAHAIKAGRLPARIRSDADPPGYAYFPSGIQTQSGKDVSGVEFIYEREPNWSLTTVSVEDLKHWLRGRGVIGGFFFPDRKPTLAAYLDPENEHYPLRLAAAVGAWQAVEDNPNLAKGKSVKTAITNWLTEHAGRLGLLASNGRPSKKAIEEIAKVANWDTKGGAPKTPSN